MIQWVKSLIKMARMVSSDDTGNFRFGQFFYQGQTSKGQIFTPYGFYHNPPNDSLAIMFAQNGQDSNRIAMVSDPKNRKKNLAKGEAGIENAVTGSFVLMKEDGSIEIDAAGAVTVNAGAEVTITAATNVTVTADNVSFILTGTSTFTIGGTSITIDSSGITVTSGDIVADGISLKGHTHPITSGSSAPGPTGTPT